MKRILSDLIVKNVGPGQWEVFLPFEYRVGGAESAEVILVPPGFRTDFASIPWGVRNFFPKDGRYTPAAVVHDYLYWTAGLYRKYSRRRADEIFLEAMGVVGVGWIRRRLMFRAVRLFGWAFWSQRDQVVKRASHA